MEKTLYGCREWNADGKNFFTKYNLITSYSETGEKIYGVEIEKYSQNENNSGFIESDRIDFFTDILQIAESTIEKLMTYLVTPCSLTNVIDDLTE